MADDWAPVLEDDWAPVVGESGGVTNPVVNPGLNYSLSPDPHAYFFQGAGQGLRNVGNTLSRATFGTPASWTNASEAYKKSPAAGSTMGQVGETLGEGAVEAPLLMGGGEGLSLLGVPGRFLTGRLSAEAPNLAKLLSTTTAGGLYGAGANALAGRSPGEGAEAGMVLAGASDLPSTIREGLTKDISPAMANLAIWARDHGVGVRSPQLRAASDASAIGKTGRGIPARTPEQAQSFTEALAKVPGMVDSNGQPATRITSGPGGTVDSTFDNLGKGFGNIADRIDQSGGVPLGQDFSNKLQDIYREASSQFDVNNSGLKDFKKQIDNLGNWQNPNQTLVINGKEFRSLTDSRSQLAKTARNANDPFQQYAQDTIHALNDALVDSTARTDPSLASDLSSLKQRYRDMLVVEPLAKKVGEDGVVEPSALLGSVQRKYKDFASTGAGDIGNLGKVGQQFLPTAPRPGSTNSMGELLNAGAHMVTHKILPLSLAGGLAAGASHAVPELLPWELGIGATYAGGKILGYAKNKLINSSPYSNLLMDWATKGRAVGDPRLPLVAGFTGSQLNRAGGQ